MNSFDLEYDIKLLLDRSLYVAFALEEQSHFRI